MAKLYLELDSDGRVVSVYNKPRPGLTPYDGPAEDLGQAFTPDGAFVDRATGSLRAATNEEAAIEQARLARKRLTPEVFEAFKTLQEAGPQQDPIVEALRTCAIFLLGGARGAIGGRRRRSREEN